MDRPGTAHREPVVEPSLAIRRNAVRGFGVGTGVAGAVFVVFVLLPGTARPVALYVGLAAVLGVSIGLLLTAALVAWRAHRLAGDL